MSTIILHPTDTCQWYTLVGEAEASTHLILDVHTESYLVFLLMRYSRNQQLVESVIGLEFLQALSVSRHRQVDLLRDVGDKSLLFSGLFPGLVKKRHLSLDYFSNIGQAAYLSAGEVEAGQWTSLFSQLSKKFMMLQQILQAMIHRSC